jgi:serine/threonine protein kinase
MAEGMHQLGKYRIVEELGASGFAIVFKAVDTTLDREVALKILHPPLLADRRFVHNFRQEAKTLAALRHPQIILIYEVGEIEGRIFIAMELARGTSLAKAIASRQRIPWDETLVLLKPVCEALDYAHEQNVVHRDLKPANLLIDKQRGALLTDFGFAKLLAENAASMSMSGGIAGTPGYIAPEVWENNAADAPVDIYALGCILYEMLTGDVLFKGQTPIQAMRAHDRGPQFLATWPEDTPAGMADVLRKALAREPAERYVSAGALWHALKDLETRVQMTREAAQLATVAVQWRAQALAAEQDGRISGARDAVQRWLEAAPEDAEAQALLRRLISASDPARKSDHVGVDARTDQVTSQVEETEQLQLGTGDNKASKHHKPHEQPASEPQGALLLIIVGWGLGGIMRLLTAPYTHFVQLASVVATTFVGATTAYALKRATSVLQSKHMLLIIVSWSIIGVLFSSSDLDLLIARAAGVLTTILVVRWAEPKLRWIQLLLMAIGWVVGGIAGLYVAGNVVGAASPSINLISNYIGTLIWGTLCGAVGGAVMLWQIYRVSHSARIDKQ